MYYTLISQNHSVVIYGKCLFWIFNRIYNVIHYNCDVGVHLVPAGCSSWSMSWDPAPVSPVWSWSVGVHSTNTWRLVLSHNIFVMIENLPFTTDDRSNFHQTFWVLSFLTLGKKNPWLLGEFTHRKRSDLFCFVLFCVWLKKACANYSKILLKEWYCNCNLAHRQRRSLFHVLRLMPPDRKPTVERRFPSDLTAGWPEIQLLHSDAGSAGSKDHFRFRVTSQQLHRMSVRGNVNYKALTLFDEIISNY